MACTFRALWIHGRLVLLIFPVYEVCCWFVDDFGGWGLFSFCYLGGIFNDEKFKGRFLIYKEVNCLKRGVEKKAGGFKYSFQ